MFKSIIAKLTNKAEKELAKQLALHIANEIKPKLMRERRQVLSANKISRHLEHIYNIAKEYQREHRLGFTRRAILANSFKWELKAAGYPEDFINVATEGLVVELSKKHA